MNSPAHQLTSSPANLYAFTLGREYKLSLAELISIFGYSNLRQFDERIAIFELSGELSGDTMSRLGGSIRIIKIIGETDEKRFPTDVIRAIESSILEYSKIPTLQDSNTPRFQHSKISFALGAYGLEYRLSDIGLRVKKTLVEK